MRPLALLSALLLASACSEGAPPAPTPPEVGADVAAPAPAPASTPVRMAGASAEWTNPFDVAEERIARGDTVPIPDGLYRTPLSACAQVEGSMGDLLVACLQPEGYTQNLEIVRIDPGSCQDVRLEYARDGIDWWEHSDGVVFASSCKGQPESHPIFVAWSMEDGDSVWSLRGGVWTEFETLHEYLGSA